jgi:hypothetical protein
LSDEVASAYAQDFTKQNFREVAAERTRPRSDHHAEGKHSDKQQTDRGVGRQTGALRHDRDSAHHYDRADCGPKDRGQTKQKRRGDPWQDTVSKCVPHKGKPAENNKGSDNRAGDRYKHPGKQSRPEKFVVDKRRKQERIQGALNFLTGKLGVERS